MTNYREMSDEELARQFHEGDEAAQAAALREAWRRDQRAAQRATQHATDRGRWSRVKDEWLDWAHSQYLAAEAECRGNLLNRAGIAAGISPWSLWSGPASGPARYASEELRNFWATNPRVTVSEFREHARQGRRHDREETS